MRIKEEIQRSGCAWKCFFECHFLFLCLGSHPTRVKFLALFSGITPGQAQVTIQVLRKELTRFCTRQVPYLMPYCSGPLNYLHYYYHYPSYNCSSHDDSDYHPQRQEGSGLNWALQNDGGNGDCDKMSSKSKICLQSLQSHKEVRIYCHYSN